MNEGDLALKLKLRPGDHFVEVSDEINALIVNYRERVVKVKALVDSKSELSADQLAALRAELQWFVTEKEEKPAS